MRITIVSGFFLPIPPLGGGATEKTWHRLAARFVARGHEVTVISRRWPGWADDEAREGVRYRRLRGFDHRTRRWQNLLLDFVWSWRVFLALPTADVVVVHAVSLPLWLGRLRPEAGRVVLMTGRMPKGQYRHYGSIARIIAPSRIVQRRVAAENPALGAVCRVQGYPIAAAELARVTAAPRIPPVTLGFVGRLHEEKGVRLLVEALERLARLTDLPPWKVRLCGPSDVAGGGSGPEYVGPLIARLHAALPRGAVEVLPPQFEDAALAGVYQSLDIFCYPSLAENGETFGVAVAEAMAAGAVPIVSQLACFGDFVRDGDNGLVFDHRSPEAADHLAQCLAALLREPGRRTRLAAEAVRSVQRLDYSLYADRLLADFEQLTAPAIVPSSAP